MDEIEYFEGYPKEVGWFDVLVDGVEDRLLHRYCHMENRHEWKDINGVRREGHILWCGEVGECP